jgi:hypothetical protein
MSQDHRVDYLGRDGFIWWLGQVEDKKDPAKQGRVKVRIAGWYTGEDYKAKMPTADLPWAHVMQPTTSGGTKNTGDSANKLEVGAVVIGFFMDGESAQQPCVLGCIRSQIEGDTSEKKTGEWIADLKPTSYGNPFSWLANRSVNAIQPQSAANDPKSVAGGNTNPNPAGQDTGPNGPTEARGVAFGQSVPGGPANGTGIPNPEPQTSADGVDGSMETFAPEVSYMIADVGIAAASTVQNGLSWVNGVQVDIQEQVDRISNFINYAANGLVADIKQLAAKAIQAVIKTITRAISGLPLVVQLLINVALKLLSKFLCMDFGDLNSLIGAIEGFLNRMVSQVVGQIVSRTTQVLSAIQGTIDSVMNAINNAINFVTNVAGQISSAVNAIKSAARAAKAGSDALDKFANLNFQNITALIMAIIDLIPWRCDRAEGNSGRRRWVPLYGGSDCDVGTLAGRGFSLSNAFQSNGRPSGNNPYARLLEVDPYETYINAAPNGAYSLVNNKRGGESRVEAGPAGSSSTLQDSKGNTHVQNQQNYTQEVGRDKCTRVRGDKIENIDGDYKLKVGGNFHIEVGGAVHMNMSQGKDRRTGKTVKSTIISQGTFEIESKENMEVKTGGLFQVAAQGEFQASSSAARLKADCISFEAGSEITNSCQTLYNNVGGAQWDTIGTNPLGLGPRGVFQLIGGVITTTHTIGLPTVPVPAYTYQMVGTPGIHNRIITGNCTKTVTGATTEQYTGANTVSITGAYTHAVTGATTYQNTGGFARNVTGSADYSAQGKSTISSAGPLILVGVPIMLN